MNILMPLFTIIMMILPGCDSSNKPNQPDDQQAQEQDQAETEAPIDVEALLKRETEIIANAPATSNNKIAFDLFAKLKTTENITFSPFSISLALAMTYAGSNTDTETAMKTTLGFGANDDVFHQSFGEFANLLRLKARGEETTIKISNVQWLDQAFKVLPSYSQAIEKNYAARPVVVDFKNDPAAATGKINSVIAEQTNNEIPKLFSSDLPPSTRLVLTNAIYFKSEWETKFEPFKTGSGEFVLKNGSKADVKYMKQIKNLQYSEDDAKQVLLIPYRDADFATVFVLPKEGKLNDVEAALNPKNLDDAIAALVSTNVSVWLPKFSQRTTPDLKSALSDLGLGILFDNQKADLSRINGIEDKERLFVESIAHEAVVKMYEEGTTAAAATGIAVGATWAMPSTDTPKEFHATRPFYFFLIHAPSKTILFMGRVDQPRES